MFEDPDSIPALKEIARFLVFMAVVTVSAAGVYRSAAGAYRYFSQEPAAVDTDISSQSRTRPAE